MKATIKGLIAENPSGLLEMKESITLKEYEENDGFSLEKTFQIFRSKKNYWRKEDWFAFPNTTIGTLFTVKEESDGDLLVVYIVDTIEEGRVYCNLILSNKAFKEILDAKDRHILAVHQMYTKFWQDHIVLNMKTCK